MMMMMMMMMVMIYKSVFSFVIRFLLIFNKTHRMNLKYTEVISNP